MLKQKILVTAALPYINNVPHMGHIVGSHLPADIFYRYCRAKGYDAIFVGGSDEHGTPSAVAAKELGLQTPICFTLSPHVPDTTPWAGTSIFFFAPRTDQSSPRHERNNTIILACHPSPSQNNDHTSNPHCFTPGPPDVPHCFIMFSPDVSVGERILSTSCIY